MLEKDFLRTRIIPLMSRGTFSECHPLLGEFAPYYGQNIILSSHPSIPFDVKAHTDSMEECINLIEKSGKIAIPSIQFGINWPSYVDIYTDNPGPLAYQYYTDWIKDNLDRFSKVIVGWCGIECGGYLVKHAFRGNWGKILDRYQEELIIGCVKEINRFLELFPWLDRKLAICPFEVTLEREAYHFQNSQYAPIKTILLDHDIWTFVMTGSFCMYSSDEEYQEMYRKQTNYKYGSAIIDCRNYPGRVWPDVSHYKSYISDLPRCVSGIGFEVGAMNGQHLSKMIQFGYHGALFFDPKEDSSIKNYLVECI